MNKEYKSGFVTIIGRPNVGKSTLMNQLIGQKIAITSNKPQTTRNRIQTVLTNEEGQIIFLDTPGIIKAKNKLGEYMLNVATRTLEEVDVILWIVEPTNFIGALEEYIIEQLKKVKTPVILGVNKIDSVGEKEILEAISTYKDVCNIAEIVPVSAIEGTGTKDLVSTIMKYLPEGPQFFGVAKASAGAIEHVPVARVSNIVQVIEELKKQGVWIAGAHMHGNYMHKQDLTGPLAIVIGSEGKGLGKLVSESCDYIVSIPMQGKINSLNASVAAGVLLYEAYRQRHAE